MTDTPQKPHNATSPWVNSEGFPAHPQSPVGGGGPGFFTVGSGVLGLDDHAAGSIPHPLSPLGRQHALQQDDVNALHASGVPLDSGVKVTGGPSPPNAPPVTQARSEVGAKRTTATDEVEVTIKILADQLNSSVTSRDSAGLQVGWTGSEPASPEIAIDAGGKALHYLGADGKKDPAGKMRYKRTVTLQIHYGADVKPTDYSAYGRGTTDADKAANNTSIGFHESCHLEAAIAYFKDVNKLPKAFSGRFGQSGKAFVEAQQAWLESFDTYVSSEKAASEQSVDEVGQTKLSDYVKKHPGHVH